MTSDSPQSRIDQFFASRKRKSTEKDVVKTIAGSPSAKGNLNSYLKSSQELGSTVKRNFSSDSSPGRQDSTKRNLNLEIHKSLNDENGRLPSSAQVIDFAGNGATHMTKHGSSELRDAANGGSYTDYMMPASGTENPELRQFANDFLSLYCRDLRTSPPTERNSQNHKRHSGPSSLEKESKKLKEGHQITFQSKKIGAVICTDDRDSQPDVRVAVSDIKMHDRSSSSREEPVCSDHIDYQLSKTIDNSINFHVTQTNCGKTRASGADKTACSTPGSLLVKSSTENTPKSICGTSISPGEGFWSEAIKLADGFCNPAAGSSHHCRTANCKKEVALRDGESGVGFTEVRTLDKYTDDFDQKGSPFPVRHFDFSCEDKSVDVASGDHDSNGSEGANCSDRESESGLLGSGGLQSTSKLVRCSRLQKIDKLDEKHEAVSITVTEGKPNIFSQNDGIKSDSPVNLAKSFNGTSGNNEAVTPSSLLQSKDWLDLSSWLPSDICNMYRKKGIQKLYQWQVDCLQVEGVLQRKNLVYCASTSAGKSFVAEILMLRRVLSTGKIAILVLPYVSICTEKAEHLDVLLEPLGKNVRSYYGNQGGGSLPKDTSVAVCTIEKANSLINRLLEECRLSEIGIIVIDELHMVGDQHRGYLLELLLTKLRYASGEGKSQSTSGDSSTSTSGKSGSTQGMQIVGMSATMPNVAAVADWLQAALYHTEFRPVPLEEYIKVGNTIYNKNMDIIRMIPKSAELGGKDPDHIVELCNEVVQDGHSVLIFCSSRKGCESTAKHVAKFLKKFIANLRDDESELASITSAVGTLRRSPAGLDPILEETLPSGVAYHHAGLTVEEREVVENCYRKGLVRVLTATSTLAAGVNLPARRVIFRQPRIGRDFIDGTRYKQMSGRAGRTGIDTKGESILICKPEEIKRIVSLVGESCPPLNSCLSEDKNGMIHAILEVVAGGIVQTANDIHRYVGCTLLNSTKPFQDVVKSAQDSLRWLCHKKFLQWNEETKLYSTTPLGRAAFGSSLTPEESLIVLEDLSRAREGFVLSSDLHLVYLVTPTNVELEPDWELYYQRFMELSAIDQSVGNRVGVAEPFLMRMAHGAPMQKVDRSRDNRKGWNAKSNRLSGNLLPDEQATRVSKRFYVSLILARLVQEQLILLMIMESYLVKENMDLSLYSKLASNISTPMILKECFRTPDQSVSENLLTFMEVPVAEVCDAFKVARGMVQSLQENAGRFASMVSVFCERLGWHDLEGLVAKFQNRVSFGVRAEIVELTNIPYVKGSRARALYKSGLRSPLAIAEASVSDIARALFESSSWGADESSAQRRMQLGVAKKIKNGARKIVLEKAEEARVAAFSTFQSLGIDVTQFPRLTVSTANRILTGKGVTKASVNVSTNSISGANSVEHVSTVAPVEEGTSSKKDASAGEILRNVSTAGLTTLGAESYHVIPEDARAKESSPPSEDAHLVSLRNLKSYDDETKGFDDQKEHNVQKQQLHRENALPVSQDLSSDKGPINAINTPGGLDSFLDLWGAVKEFYFDIHYSKLKDLNSLVPFEIHGFAICWEHSPVFYINVLKDIFGSYKRKSIPVSMSSSTECSPTECSDRVKRQWGRISGIFGKIGVRKFSWNFKVQTQVLRNCTVSLQKVGSANNAGKSMGLEVIESSYLVLPPIDVRDAIDVSIAVWILWPDEEKSANPNLEKVVKKRLSNEVAAAAHRCGRWNNQMRKAAHDGCCRRVAQIRALWGALWKLLLHEKLSEALFQLEMPLVNVVADMEMWGIGVDMEGCLYARKALGEKLRDLEKEAHSLAGVKFSLFMTADIANVLYGHLKLPIPESGVKGKQHPSTDKHCLDLLRNEHPIIPVIKEHRALSKLLNSTLGSICSLARLSVRTQRYILHGHWLQTSTATGRLSMEEPNLQCVEHMVDFKIIKDKNGDDSVGEFYKVNARDFVTPTQENWLLLTADYSQIELRLMAHFSKDSALVELLSKPQGDVFTMIAAKWTGRPEGSISSNERDLTKRMIYGILYGMGAKSLAEQLNCSSDEALEKIKSFKSSFPAVDSWLQEAVSGCRQKGYVETLRGRRRFLSKINMGNNKEKSKAQRQAVNSICQGSAADIIKIAMINIHKVIVGVHKSDSFAEKFHMLKGHCRIILQVHDELVLEADPSVTKEAAELLKSSMENAASLRVPLRVKLNIGRTWGSLEPYQSENIENSVLFPNS